MAWQRLIKFRDDTGQQQYGDPCIDKAEELLFLARQGKLEAVQFQGDDLFSLRSTGHRLRVRRLLNILDPADVPAIHCVGLNYANHIREAGRAPPPYPSTFMKPRTAVAGFEEDIPIPLCVAQGEGQCDYEGELSIIIGKTAKDVPESKALDYIAGFVASNDVSSRKWQRDPNFAGGVPQWCFSKGFDKWAPTSAMIVSPRLVGDGSGLNLKTFVNGELRQDSNTDDLVFSSRCIVAFLSQGRTLEKGTIIMMGTPAGTAIGLTPSPWLRHGDTVRVEIESIGSVENRVVFKDT